MKRYFATLAEARAWQSDLKSFVELASEDTNQASDAKPKSGPSLGEVIDEWKRRKYPGFAVATRVAYDKIINLYFEDLVTLSVHELTPQAIDLWIDCLKNPTGKAMASLRRLSFGHELELLGTILKYYQEYNDDPTFVYPIKKRHRDDVVVRRREKAKPKDLTEEQFHKFREELQKLHLGAILAPLATVQFYQALRVSEAAGLYWEDVRMELTDLRNSRIVIRRIVEWPRRKGVSTRVRAGFKNGSANEGEKELPMFPETFRALDSLRRANGNIGLVFHIDGKPLEYRQIQYAYDQAFKAAGLPFTATHVMRHGGCRRVFNRTNGDTAIAQQLLGNTTLESTLVYAKRQKGALTAHAHLEWDEAQAGRNWSQKEG